MKRGFVGIFPAVYRGTHTRVHTHTHVHIHRASYVDVESELGWMQLGGGEPRWKAHPSIPPTSLPRKKGRA